MHYKKKILCLALAALLLIPCLPIPARAARPMPVHNNGVPLFFQTDYPHIRYSDGTMATSGCGPTCLAMVATYLTNYAYTPDRIAAYFTGGKDNVVRLEEGSTALGLTWRKATDFYDALKALKQGDLVIAMMGPESLFTTSQHFVVLTGLAPNGDILVNDPMRPHYDDPLLEHALRDGFTEGETIMGFCGAWIYDAGAMEQTHTPYYHPRYPELSDAQKDLVAAWLWHTGRDRDIQCQQALAEVLLNRVADWQFPDTLEEVVCQDFPQWRSLGSTQPTQEQYDALEMALTGPNLLPLEVVYQGEPAPNPNVWKTFDGVSFCYPDYIAPSHMTFMNQQFQDYFVPQWRVG